MENEKTRLMNKAKEIAERYGIKDVKWDESKPLAYAQGVAMELFIMNNEEDLQKHPRNFPEDVIRFYEETISLLAKQ